MSHSTVAIFCLHTILGAQALNAATHVKANAKIDADSTFCSGPVMFDHSVRVNGLKDPLRCLEDKFDGALGKMLQLCGDVHGTKDESIAAAKVKAGTWLQYATESTKCSDRWPYMLKIEQGVHSSDTATQQLTLDVLKATVAWSYPLAKAGTSFDDAYEHMDTSADGRLDSSEFKPKFTPYDTPVVDTLFQIVDGNGDAYITNAELLAYMRGIYPIADISPEAIWPSSIVSDTSIPDIEFEAIGDTILNWCNFFHMNEQPVSTLQMGRAMVKQPVISLQTVRDTTQHGCGAPHVLSNGTKIFDMPPGSPSTCKGTYALVDTFLADLEQGSLAVDRLSDMITTVASLSTAGTSFTDLWDGMPKTTSGEVEVSVFDTLFHTTLMDVDKSGRVSWHEAGNYNHAILEIGGEGGVFDPNAVCAWAACA
mmetsp:Transcript_136028/g.290816  ORF Transcript_136028/g.290816 Transcript_136028/m.290816 type:complete len:424 (-) Transcript_136028:106-1377(-)